MGAELFTQAGIAEQAPELGLEIGLLAAAEEQSGAANGIGQAAAIGGQHHAAAGQALKRHHPEGLAPARGHHHDFVLVEGLHQSLPLQGAPKINGVADSQLGAEALKRGTLGPVADQAQAPIGWLQVSKGLQQQIGPLVAHQPAQKGDRAPAWNALDNSKQGGFVGVADHRGPGAAVEPHGIAAGDQLVC